MKKNFPIGIHFLWFVALMLWLFSGCAPVERWGVFKPDDDRYLLEEKAATEDGSDRFQPKMAELPRVEMPPLEEPLVLSIEDVTLLALQNNGELQVQQLNPIIAGTFEKIEKGIFDPEMFAEFEYTEETASETSRATGEQFDVDAADTTTLAGIRQDLPTGTILEISVAHERHKSNRAPDQENARIGMSITQSLLQGFGPAVNLVNVRQTELDTLASIYELRGFTEALVTETEIAYWNYVLSLQEISIYESSLAIARQQRSEVEQQIGVGLLPEIEAAAARAEVARREQALIGARSLMEERRLRLLNLISSGDANQLNRQIKATSPPSIEPSPICDEAQRLALADKSRPDLGEARLRMQQGRLDIIATRNGMLPKLDLFIELGRTGFANNMSESFRRLDDNTYDFTAGLKLNHYLGNRASAGRYEAARASHRQAAMAVENLRQIVALDVRLAVNEIETNRQQITASRVTRLLEEQTVNAEKQRFDVGDNTAIMVAQAQRDLLVSQIAEIRAIINYRISLVKLYLAEGSLLQRRGVTIGDPESSGYD